MAHLERLDRRQQVAQVRELAQHILDAGTAPGVVVVLRHDQTSGLPDYFDLPALEPTFAHPPVRQRPLVVAAGEADPWHEPGAGQNYANSNYATLGLLDEKVTGRSLADVLDARIFAPLGMRSASLRPRRVRQPPFAHGYAEARTSPTTT